MQCRGNAERARLSDDASSLLCAPIQRVGTDVTFVRPEDAVASRVDIHLPEEREILQGIGVPFACVLSMEVRPILWLGLVAPQGEEDAAYSAEPAVAPTSSRSTALPVSTRMPGPIVVARVAERMYLPLAPDGLARMISSITAW